MTFWPSKSSRPFSQAVSQNCSDQWMARKGVTVSTSSEAMETILMNSERFTASSG
jgi:hypothetical protein